MSYSRVWKRFIRIVRSKPFLMTVGTILGVFVLLFAVYWSPAHGVYTSALKGKAALDFAQEFLRQENFRQAESSLEQAREHFHDAESSLHGLRSVRILPYARVQYDAIENLVIAAQQSTSAVQRLASFGNALFTIVEGDGSSEINLATISEEQKVELLQEMIEAGPILQGARAEIDLTAELIDRIPREGIAGPIRNVVEPLREELPSIQDIIQDLIPLVQTLPEIAGYPESKTYLFLLQNNTELRPTGGFIGTYGILTVGAGEIETFDTDNVYNLDVPAKEYLDREPPEPIQRYLRQEQWFFRDSNWSPDFPTAARQALEFYRLEQGAHADDLDGVIAVTPSLIESLLGLTGEIDIEGVKFTKDTVVDTLEYQVEQGFYREGISEANRKEIIGQLASRLLDEVLALPKQRWPDLLNVLQENLKEKHILVYYQDPTLQETIVNQDWAGHVLPAEDDYLMVVDANLASLKTDPGVHRTITYRVDEQDDGSFIGDLSIQYENKGYLDWKTTRYRTYTRVYVPKGSELLSYEGAMVNDRLQSRGQLGTADVSDQFDKTEFGVFIAIEVQESGTLHFTYRLPDWLAERIRSTGYQLYVQKQPGTDAHALHIEHAFKRRVQYTEALDTTVVAHDTRVALDGDLREDRQLTVVFE